MGIPLDKAELLALLLESIIYGVFLTFYLLLLVVSFGEKDISIANPRFRVPIGTLMMVLATAHLTIDFVRANEAFVTGTQTHPPSPIAYYQVLDNPFHVAKTPVYALQTLLGDSVLVWRCYVIYNKRWYVLIPAVIILLANLAIAVVISWSLSVAVPGRNIFQTAQQWIAAFYIITMSLNVCCTGAIVGKVWLAHRHSTTASHSLLPVIAVIIESGAIYSASVLGLLISYLVYSNGEYPALDLVTPLVGVTYCLIVLQIHFHFRLSSGGSTSGATSNWTIPQFWRRDARQDEMTILGPGSLYD